MESPDHERRICSNDAQCRRKSAQLKSIPDYHQANGNVNQVNSDVAFFDLDCVAIDSSGGNFTSLDRDLISQPHGHYRGHVTCYLLAHLAG
jgi:hypothetical protein